MVECVPDHSIEGFLDRCAFVVLHIDASWDAAHRPVMRASMKAAATKFGTSVAFGEIDCDLPFAGEFCRRLDVVNVPAVAYFRLRRLVAVVGFRHDVSDRTLRLFDLGRS